MQKNSRPSLRQKARRLLLSNQVLLKNRYKIRVSVCCLISKSGGLQNGVPFFGVRYVYQGFIWNSRPRNSKCKKICKIFLDMIFSLRYTIDCSIVRDYVLRYIYAQKAIQTAERTEVEHQWRKTEYVLLRMVKESV